MIFINKRLKVALVGNPNSGKSTLFNLLTGLNQKTSNFPGVTIDKKTGSFAIAHPSGNQFCELIDLPGTYSINPKTPEEEITSDFLLNENSEEYPDVVLFIADSVQLKRSLFLCTQICDLNIPVILVLNMADIAAQKNIAIDEQRLSQTLGISVVSANSRSAASKEKIVSAIKNFNAAKPLPFLNTNTFCDSNFEEKKNTLGLHTAYAAFHVECRNILTQNKNDSQEKISSQWLINETHHRYKKINDLLPVFLNTSNNRTAPLENFTKKADKILTHKVWGFAVFVFILFAVFQSVFYLAQFPTEWFESGMLWASNQISGLLPTGIINDLLVNGVLAGLTGVLIFIPQIVLLLFFIALLEDTGYMARVSFIMDKLVKRFGINGRSVIPLASAAACAVPAILSARTVPGNKERLITILVAPFMSCSARLPVYTLLITLVIPNIFVAGFINLHGLVLFSLYVVGVLAALIAAYVLKKVLKSTERGIFVMEMPIYRLPRWSSVFINIFDKIKVFILEAGKVIVAISIVLWALSSFSLPGVFEEIDQKYEIMLSQVDAHEENLINARTAEKLENSFAGMLGKSIEPIIKPLGFDWKIGIALLTSFAAREVFVGTMATLYSVGNQSNDLLTVRKKMSLAVNPDTGEPFFSLPVALSLIFFYAFALQCMSTLAVVKKETGSWKWPLIQFIFMGLAAYLASYIIFSVFS
ncbi:MAG TPA: ferrous iron transport protein B [Bacteroidia bacterium]|nr:ferrous iron transport protein B [Bacteroidia bacterium]HNT79704.1 ferrous iron transport protein B [Bacteroidia bacterium]